MNWLSYLDGPYLYFFLPKLTSPQTFGCNFESEWEFYVYVNDQGWEVSQPYLKDKRWEK